MPKPREQITIKCSKCKRVSTSSTDELIKHFAKHHADKNMRFLLLKDVHELVEVKKDSRGNCQPMSDI